MAAAAVEGAIATATSPPDCGWRCGRRCVSTCWIVGSARPTATDCCASTSRGGRIDLADDSLAHVGAPTQLVVGAADVDTCLLSRPCAQRLAEPVTLQLVLGAGHAFEEPGAIGIVGECVTAWLTRQRRTDRFRRWWSSLPLWPSPPNAGNVAQSMG